MAKKRRRQRAGWANAARKTGQSGNNELPVDSPYHIMGIRPFNHAEMVRLFFDENGRLILEEDELVITEAQAINFSENDDVRYYVEIKKDSKTWNRMKQLILIARKKNDVYFKVSEIKELKLVIGGTELQAFHGDAKVIEARKEEAEKRQLLQKVNACLITCDDQYPARIAVLNQFVNEPEQWSKIKREFRETEYNLASVEELDNNSESPPHAIFRCMGVVFDGTCSHAGMPVQYYSQANEESAIKKLEKRSRHATWKVNYSFLTKLDKLSAITRIFISTWPEDMFGDKDNWVESGDVDLTLM